MCIERKSGIKLMNERLFQTYFDKFNFYFAKPINEILANVTVRHVIYFKDYLYFDDFNEYLKRYYTKPEIVPRVKFLTDFYSS